MSVDHSRFHILVAKKFLDCTDVIPVFKKMRGISCTPSPSASRKRQACRRAFTFGSKNKVIAATGNLRHNRWTCKKKICQKSQNEANPSGKRMGILLDRRNLLEREIISRTDAINQVGPDAEEKKNWI
jgi:hypothetical protein